MTAVQEVEQLLESARQELGADSCTFYVADPYWPNEYRLVCMHGVRFPESMYGFITPDPRTRRRVCEGDNELFCTEPGDDVNSVPDSISPDKKPLFWEFSAREKVQSYARMRNCSPDGELEAILFVNFGHKAAFDEEFKSRLRALKLSVQQFIPAIQEELRQADARPLAEAVRILQPVQAFVRNWKPPFERKNLGDQFERIIKRSLGALEIEKNEGFGTIHLYDPGAGKLRLEASWGIQDPKLLDNARVQNVLQGEGTISWVVLRQRTLLIRNIQTSEFRKIQVVVDDQVTSELAVPMIANGELVGVINLECRRPNAFSPGSVRSIWYAAEQAALMYQAWRNGRTTWLLGDCTAEAIKTGQPTRGALDTLAGILRESLGADLCDLWHFNLERERLEFVGASYKLEEEPGIRKDGWTNFVWRTRKIVWITGIQDPATLSANAWQDGVWSPVADRGAPALVNEFSVKAGVSTEMGIPILVAGTCVAVAWLKYKYQRVPPGPELLVEARLWANQAGIVVESVHRQLERPATEQLHRVARSMDVYWRTEVLDFGRNVPIEGYAYHLPFHGPACGDFHAVTMISDTAAGVLIGDGEGHAVSGLMNALPMIATFNSFAHDATSSRYLMEKLMAASNALGVKGTAVYCTFTIIQDRKHRQVYLSATSAGHPTLILLRASEGWNYELFPKTDFARGIGLGYFKGQDDNIKLPFGEDMTELKPRDILIGFTDGISESFSVQEDPNIPAYVQPIVDAARSKARDSCQEIAKAIADAAKSANPSVADDATVCVIRILPKAQ